MALKRLSIDGSSSLLPVLIELRDSRCDVAFDPLFLYLFAVILAEPSHSRRKKTSSILSIITEPERASAKVEQSMQSRAKASYTSYKRRRKKKEKRALGRTDGRTGERERGNLGEVGLRQPRKLPDALARWIDGVYIVGALDSSLTLGWKTAAHQSQPIRRLAK